MSGAFDALPTSSELVLRCLQEYVVYAVSQLPSLRHALQEKRYDWCAFEKRTIDIMESVRSQIYSRTDTGGASDLGDLTFSTKLPSVRHKQPDMPWMVRLAGAATQVWNSHSRALFETGAHDPRAIYTEYATSTQYVDKRRVAGLRSRLVARGLTESEMLVCGKLYTQCRSVWGTKVVASVKKELVGMLMRCPYSFLCMRAEVIGIVRYTNTRVFNLSEGVFREQVNALDIVSRRGLANGYPISDIASPHMNCIQLCRSCGGIASSICTDAVNYSPQGSRRVTIGRNGESMCVGMQSRVKNGRAAIRLLGTDELIEPAKAGKWMDMCMGITGCRDVPLVAVPAVGKLLVHRPLVTSGHCKMYTMCSGCARWTVITDHYDRRCAVCKEGAQAGRKKRKRRSMDAEPLMLCCICNKWLSSCRDQILARDDTRVWVKCQVCTVCVPSSITDVTSHPARIVALRSNAELRALRKQTNLISGSNRRRKKKQTKTIDRSSG